MVGFAVVVEDFDEVAKVDFGVVVGVMEDLVVVVEVLDAIDVEVEDVEEIQETS